MKPNQTDVVGEYLHEVDRRLSGLPLLQRRELLADLAAHIETERTERNVRSEGELLEILERLGSPDVVAAAAYEEAGPPPAVNQQPYAAAAPPFGAAAPPPYAATPPFSAPARGNAKRLGWIIAAVAAVAVLLLLCFGLALARGDSSEPAPSVTRPPVPERHS
ncbi:HAAS signaling domain-containing protein [Actinoplanes siamensis]|uniref:Uncharacterized protein n=1 Tax=Actinoplanes siamensis TaxID=1223317 RepID=A0A919N6P1_9ACTN|nr:hypothetical protein [Actinoplanes siamensis]GIF05342.1 hypothetical protein Asi03nite_28800 [Actinoplanes siamensis]